MHDTICCTCIYAWFVDIEREVTTLVFRCIIQLASERLAVLSCP